MNQRTYEDYLEQQSMEQHLLDMYDDHIRGEEAQVAWVKNAGANKGQRRAD